MRANKNVLEWTVFAISLAVLIALVGFLAYLVMEAGDRPPDLVVALGEPQETTDGYAVPVRVANRGDRTAEEVRVHIRMSGGGASEERELTFAYVPRRSEREGFVTFDRDPRCCRLAALAAAYETP